MSILDGLTPAQRSRYATLRRYGFTRAQALAALAPPPEPEPAPQPAPPPPAPRTALSPALCLPHLRGRSVPRTYRVTEPEAPRQVAPSPRVSICDRVPDPHHGIRSGGPIR